MSGAQLALNVDDLDEAVTFYGKLVQHLAGKGQAGVRELRHRRAANEAGPAREIRAKGGTTNYLGVEVEDRAMQCMLRSRA